MTTAELILLLIGAYAAAGLAFALTFAVRGAPRIDEAVHGAPTLFRVLIVPGSAALWPLMLAKWLRAAREKGREP